jgi:PTH2 family peptidyl-tRNA hydrolase
MSSQYEYKQALVLRMDIKMGRGKIAVQCAHAAVGAAEVARARFPDWWRSWLNDGQAKIALKVPDISTMLKLERGAKDRGLPHHMVEDRGLTQIPPGTITCLGIGPAPSSLLDVLTGNLPLL